MRRLVFRYRLWRATTRALAPWYRGGYEPSPETERRVREAILADLAEIERPA